MPRAPSRQKTTAEFVTSLLGFDVDYHDRVNGVSALRVNQMTCSDQAWCRRKPVWIANTLTIVAVAVIMVVINPLLGSSPVAGLPIVGNVLGTNGVRRSSGSCSATRGSPV